MRIISFVFFILVAAAANCQWNSNPVINNIVTNAPDYQGGSSIASDGAGGVIITWYGNVNATDNYIYAQRFDAHGNILWAGNGVEICSATGIRYFPQIASDGNGGALISWPDKRNGNSDIYAQLIDSNGVAQWLANGVAVCTAANDQDGIIVLNNAPGNFIISWFDYRGGSTTDIYAQQLNAGGNALWAADGVAISTASAYQLYPDIITDGNDGAIICWQDNRSGNYDIYAQRINSSGTTLWIPSGAAVCTAAGTQGDAKLISDGNNGAIITWEDYRFGSSSDIYAGRINALGIPQWANNGVAVCTEANYQQDPKIISDGSGGAIITFMDLRNSVGFANNDIYTQRINANGSNIWIANGVAVCNNASDQRYPKLATNNNGGAFITWMDKRGTDQDIYAQMINNNGVSLWPGNGIAICKAANNQDYPLIINNKNNEAVIAWEDLRNGNNDIYASRLTDGIISLCPPASGTVMNTNLNGTVFQWQLSTDGGATFADITDNANYMGSNSASLQLINIPSSWYGYQYRCVTDGSNSISFTLRFVSYWKGANSSAWEDAGNWSCGNLPDANTEVIIDNGNVLLNSNAACRSLAAKTGVAFTINPGFTLTVTR